LNITFAGTDGYVCARERRPMSGIGRQGGGLDQRVLRLKAWRNV